MTDFELLLEFLKAKEDFNYSAVEGAGSTKKIIVDNKTLIFAPNGRYLECIKHKERG